LTAVNLQIDYFLTCLRVVNMLLTGPELRKAVEGCLKDLL